jgi:hypothetical protein
MWPKREIDPYVMEGGKLPDRYNLSHSKPIEWVLPNHPNAISGVLSNEQVRGVLQQPELI